MNGRDWLGKRLRIYPAFDIAKTRPPMTEGEVVSYLDGSSIEIRAADGSVRAWSVSMPMDEIAEEAPLADWERELLIGQTPVTPAYPPYDPDKPCLKCGTEDVTTKWHHGHHLWTGYGVTIARWDMYADYPDWLLRTCTCCGYAWPEAPVDQDAR